MGMCDSFGSLRSGSGGGAQRRGLKDQLSRRPGMGNGDGVRGARDLDRAVGARAQGHVVLEGDRDVAVLLAEHEPRRALAPKPAPYPGPTTPPGSASTFESTAPP